MADPNCKKCGGTGWFRYDHNHSTVCDACCKCNQGWWQLKEHYGTKNGKWCCIAGCGRLLDAPPAGTQASEKAKCEGFADTSGGGHRPLGDCADCARFSWDCGYPGDGDEWVDPPSSQLGCPLKLTVSDSRTKGHPQ